MDLPVDLKQFFLYSAMVAAGLFCVLSILPAFIQPMTMAALCAVLLLLSGRILNAELKKIRLQERHLYDYGDMSGEKKAKLKSKVSTGLGISFLIILYFVLVLSAFGTTTGSSGTVAPTFILTLISQIVISVKLGCNTAGMRNKSGIVPALVAPAILLFGPYVGFNPMVFPNDAWYYGLASGCLVGIMINILFAISRYNDLATRPVPNFFRREGANNARS